MKAIMKAEPGPGLKLTDVEVPEPGIDDVLIRIKKTSICGTDVHIYSWDHWAEQTIKPPMVISLAKKEELIYVQEKTEPIHLRRDNVGLKLCQAIRDEAHRFAQHYHHILRRKRVLEEE